VLENLPPDTLPRLLRRTSWSALIVATIGFIVALVIDQPWAALGLVFGVFLAVMNLRFLDRQAAKVELKGEQSSKAIRRQLGSRTSGRLAVVTVIVVVALLITAPLGVGIVTGLVLYQVVFFMNVLRVVASQGGIE